MHRKHRVTFTGALVEQLVIILRHFYAWKHLGSNFGSKPLPRVVSQGRMVAVGQHPVHDAPLIERSPKRFRHVGEILAHLLGTDARHEAVVLDLDGRDRGLVEKLSEHHQSILEEGVALHRRQVRGACYDDDAGEPRPGTAHSTAGCSVWCEACGVLKRRGAGQR